MGWTLRVIMLSEVSQVKTFKYGMMSLMCVESRNKPMNQMEETHRENRVVVPERKAVRENTKWVKTVSFLSVTL